MFRQRFFPANFAKCSRIAFLKSTSRGLVLFDTRLNVLKLVGDRKQLSADVL